MRDITLKIENEYAEKNAKSAGVQGSGNVNDLIVSFGAEWDGYAKTITWWNAKGLNPVKQTLTSNLLDDTSDIRTYRIAIPPEPLEFPGECMAVIDGYIDGRRVRSTPVRFKVIAAPVAADPTDPTDPTPTQAEQLQAQIDAIKQDIIGAAAAADAKEAAEAAAESAEESAQSAAQSASSAASAASSAASSAQSAANSAQLAQSAVGKTSYIGENGNWFEWDSELGTFVDSGVPATGLRDQNNGEIVRFWFGTVAEYNALTTIRSDTYYNILEGEV